MGVLTTTTHIEAILAHPAIIVRPRVFVELGTFEGRMAAMATAWFPEVHTVEQSPVYHEKAKALHSGSGIHFHLGDSREVLPRLAAEIQEPVLFYHDAHWWPHPDVVKSFPLWDDLQTMATRPYADVIVVDEVHRFGEMLPTPDWRQVSLERIASRFPGYRAATISNNQAVVIR